MKAAFAEPKIVTRNGKPVSVIIPIRDYREMMERLEDADDTAYLANSRTKLLSHRPLSDYLAECRKARA